MRKYKFDWSLIGDITAGRPNLGNKIELESYRLMQFTLRDVIEERYGVDETDRLFFDAGKLAGKTFFEKHIDPVSSLEEFVSKTQNALREKGIGILRIEEASMDDGKVMLTIDEDLDCSGLPELDYETCIYDEGFVSALFEAYTNQPWSAKEIDCWCTGARTCRFSVVKQ
jgi:predicted hydrocarbon binding protein